MVLVDKSKIVLPVKLDDKKKIPKKTTIIDAANANFSKPPRFLFPPSRFIKRYLARVLATSRYLLASARRDLFGEVT